MATVGAMDSAEATTALTAAINGYRMEASDAMSIVDSLTQLDLRFAASAGGIATALSKVASVASQVGISLEKMEAILTVTQDQTQQSAETIGTAWNSILQRVNNIAAGKDIDDFGESLNNVDKVLKKVGINLRDEEGQIRNVGEVLDEVAASWNTYTRNQQAQISTAIAGTRQANFFRAAMADWEEVLEGTELAMNASGSATERMAIWSESLQGKLNSLKDSWDKFVMGLGSNEVFEDIIDILTGLLDILDLLINKIPILSNLIKVTLVAQAINVLFGSLKQLKTLLGKSGLSLGGLINVQTIKDVVSGFTDANAVIKETVTTTEGATQVTTNYAVALGKAAKSAVNFAIANPAVAVAALTAAVVAGIAAFAIYNNSIAAAEKKYKDLAEKAEESQSEVDSLESELSGIDSQIEAINDKGTLTLADKTELEELQSQRKELELILATKENIAKIDAKNAADAAAETVNKKYGNDNISVERNKVGGGSGSDLRYATSGAITFDDWETILKNYDALDRKKQAGIALTEYEQDAYDELSKAMSEEALEVKGYLDSMEAAGDTASEAFETAQNAYDSFESRINPDEWRSVKLSDFIDSNQLLQNAKESIETIKDQFTSGLIDEQAYNQKLKDVLFSASSNPEVAEAVKSIYNNLENVNTQDIANTLAEVFGASFEQAVNQVDLSSMSNLVSNLEGQLDDINIKFKLDMTEFDGMYEAATSLEEIDDLVNSVQNSFQGYYDQLDMLDSAFSSLGSNIDAATQNMDWVSENMDVFTGQVQLSGEELKNFYSEMQALPSVIDPVTGQTISAWEQLHGTIGATGQATASASQDATAFLGSVQGAGNNTITTMNYVINAIMQVKLALADAMDAAGTFVMNIQTKMLNIANSVEGSPIGKFIGVDLSFVKDAANGLSSVITGLHNQASSIRDSAKIEQAQLIQQTQQYQKQLGAAGAAADKAYNDSVSKGAGSAKKATEDLTDALKEQYEAEKAILEQQKEQLQMQKELLNAEKERLNDAKDAINDLIDMTMDMLKQQYQDEIDVLDKQKDALEDQLDAFEEKINKQKEILELQRKEEEHQDELAEKNKTIADIQAELAEIQFDNSAEGQKRRLELLEELNQAQQDLNDYQSDHDYEVKNDALDKELDAYKQMIEAKKELIDQQEEYIREQMENDYNLYMQAIQLIEGRSGEFYNRLVEWNRIYGTHLDIDGTNPNVHYIVICNENHTYMQVNPKALH